MPALSSIVAVIVVCCGVGLVVGRWQWWDMFGGLVRWRQDANTKNATHGRIFHVRVKEVCAKQKNAPWGAFWCSACGEWRRICQNTKNATACRVFRVLVGEGGNTLLCPHIPGGIHMEWFCSINFTWIPYTPTMDSIHFHMDSMHFQMDSMHFQMDSMHFQMDSMHFQMDSMHFQVDSMQFHMDSMQFHMDSMQFQVDSMQF